jgi:hypothetical protein
VRYGGSTCMGGLISLCLWYLGGGVDWGEIAIDMRTVGPTSRWESSSSPHTDDSYPYVCTASTLPPYTPLQPTKIAVLFPSKARSDQVPIMRALRCTASIKSQTDPRQPRQDPETA